MKKSDMIVEISIPHQMPPKVYTFDDLAAYQRAAIDEANRMGEAGYTWQEWDAESAAACWGEDEIPPELAALIAKHGRAIQRNDEFLAPEEAGTEYEWALDAVGHDYHAHMVLTGTEAVEMALGDCKFHQGIKVRHMLTGILKAELDRTEWPVEWVVEYIMEEIEAVDELEAGDAMYYDKATGEIEIGRDGCQRSGTMCLRVGPDEIGNLDLGEIESTIESQLASTE